LKQWQWNFTQRRKGREDTSQGNDTEKEQKSIDDAKALLMERNHLSEEEAHKYIQKLSMDSGNNLVGYLTFSPLCLDYKYHNYQLTDKALLTPGPP